jgi:hypothetical protein
VEVLIDAFQVEGDRAYLREARALGQILETFAYREHALLGWLSDSSGVHVLDYMTGAAGIAMCALRLAEPERRPHQLSRRGFKYRASVCAA